MRVPTRTILFTLLLLFIPICATASEEAVQLFSIIPIIGKIPMHVSLFFAVGILIIVLAFFLRKKILASLSGEDELLAPPERFGLRAVLETITQLFTGLAEQSIGHEAKRYLPVLLTFAVVILVSNVIGLIPGFSPPTGNWSTTIALALVAFIYYHITGFQEHGIKYLAQFLGPLTGVLKIAFAPLMLPIELIGHFARIISLSLRLFVNMWGDHQVVGVFAGFIVVPLVYTIPFSALGLLVCLIQTFVFVLLTTTYISLAVSHEH